MKVSTFENGIHPSYYKELTSKDKTVKMPISKTVVIPLQQHIGQPCTALVEKKDLVEEGQLIAEASGFMTAPIHSSVSGKVKDIDMQYHPGGGRFLSVTITTDGEEKDWYESEGEIGLDFTDTNPESLRKAIRDAGVVGMGGAAFPSAVKLTIPSEKNVETVILNACECEPYLTTDHRLMLEEPDRVLWGLKAIMETVGAKYAYIGVEDNKLDAIEVLEEAIERIIPGTKVIALETKYPQGAEKMLIKAVLDKTVPIGKLPMDVGCVVNNVATAFAIYEALKLKKPLIDRIVTVSGNGIKEPKNIAVKIGTLFDDVINFCGGLVEGEEREVLHGGPMMGLSQQNLIVPVVKGTSGITVLKGAEVTPEDYDPCIRCAACVEACPMDLMAHKIADMGRLIMTDPFDGLQGMSCIECGCCAYVCPSKRPLVEWIRVGKTQSRIATSKAIQKAAAEKETAGA